MYACIETSVCHFDTSLSHTHSNTPFVLLPHFLLTSNSAAMMGILGVISQEVWLKQNLYEQAQALNFSPYVDTATGI